MDGHILNEHPI